MCTPSSCSSHQLCSLSARVATLQLPLAPPPNTHCPIPPPNPPRRRTVALTHYTVKSSITPFFKPVFFSSTLLCGLNFDHYKHCSKCYQKKCTLGFLCVFLYKAGRSRLLRLPAFVPLSSPSATSTALRPSSASDLECLDMRRSSPLRPPDSPPRPPAPPHLC